MQSCCDRRSCVIGGVTKPYHARVWTVTIFTIYRTQSSTPTYKNLPTPMGMSHAVSGLILELNSQAFSFFDALTILVVQVVFIIVLVLLKLTIFPEEICTCNGLIITRQNLMIRWYWPTCMLHVHNTSTWQCCQMTNFDLHILSIIIFMVLWATSIHQRPIGSCKHPHS